MVKLLCRYGTLTSYLYVPEGYSGVWSMSNAVIKIKITASSAHPAHIRSIIGMLYLRSG